MGRGNRMLAKCPHCETGATTGSCIRRNAAGKVTGTQHQCRVCQRYWTVPIDQEPELVANDREVIPLAAIPQFPGVSEREQRVRQVFALFPRWDRAKIGRVVGKSRESVRQILIGKILASEAPDLQRYDAVILAAMSKRTSVGGELVPTCHRCLLGIGEGETRRCSIGIPEAESDPWFAAMCGAYQDGDGPPEQPEP
jgi:hypothetical protein